MPAKPIRLTPSAYHLQMRLIGMNLVMLYHTSLEGALLYSIIKATVCISYLTKDASHRLILFSLQIMNEPQKYLSGTQNIREVGHSSIYSHADNKSWKYRAKSRKVYRCSDGMCGGEDCATCFPLTAHAVYAAFQDEE